LLQTGLLANELLKQQFKKHGYYQSQLWYQDFGSMSHALFNSHTVVFDDFSINYVGREHAKHLKQVLKEHYKVTTNWTGG
jgi:hypothetical protein